MKRSADNRDRGVLWRSGPSYWLFAASLVSIAAIALSNVLLGLAALTAPWKKRSADLRAARPFLIAIAAYLAFLIASIITSYDPRASLRATSDFFNFLVPVVALLVVRRSVQARLIFKVLIVLGAGIAIWALVQFALGADNLEARATGPFSHYMTLGGFLVLVDCLLLAYLAFGNGWRRWWTWAALVVIQAALLVSYTRNAWIALFILFTVVVAIRKPKLLVAWVPIVLVLTLVAPSSLAARFGSIFDMSDASNYDRVCMIYAGLNMIEDRPVLGHGPRMVRERYPIYRHPTAPRTWVPHLHNSFLSLAAERGLASLAALLALLFVSGRRAVQRLRSSSPNGSNDQDLFAATLLVILATLVTGVLEDYWNDTEIQRLVLFSLALPFSIDDDST